MMRCLTSFLLSVALLSGCDSSGFKNYTSQGFSTETKFECNSDPRPDSFEKLNMGREFAVGEKSVNRKFVFTSPGAIYFRERSPGVNVCYTSVKFFKDGKLIPDHPTITPRSPSKSDTSTLEYRIRECETWVWTPLFRRYRLDQLSYFPQIDEPLDIGHFVGCENHIQNYTYFLTAAIGEYEVPISSVHSRTRVLQGAVK